MKKNHIGSTLDSPFEELGELEEVNALAAKKIEAEKARRTTPSNRRRIVGTRPNEPQRR